VYGTMYESDTTHGCRFERITPRCPHLNYGVALVTLAFHRLELRPPAGQHGHLRFTGTINLPCLFICRPEPDVSTLP